MVMQIKLIVVVVVECLPPYINEVDSGISFLVEEHNRNNRLARYVT